MTYVCILRARSLLLLATYLSVTCISIARAESALGYSYKIFGNSYIDNADIVRGLDARSGRRKVLVEVRPILDGPRFYKSEVMAERSDSCLQTSSQGTDKECSGHHVPEYVSKPETWWESPDGISNKKPVDGPAIPHSIERTLTDLFGTLRIVSPYPERGLAEFVFSISGYKFMDYSEIVAAYPNAKGPIEDPYNYDDKPANPGRCERLKLLNSDHLRSERTCLWYSRDLTNSHTLLMVEFDKQDLQYDISADDCKAVLVRRLKEDFYPGIEFGGCIGAIWGGARSQRISVHLFELRSGEPLLLGSERAAP
jgi:hypothetical protein